MKPARAKSPTPAPSAVATVPELLTAQSVCRISVGYWERRGWIANRLVRIGSESRYFEAHGKTPLAAIAALLLKMTEAAEMAAAEAGAGAVRRKDGKRPYALPWPVKRALRGVSGARITAKLN